MLVKVGNVWVNPEKVYGVFFDGEKQLLNIWAERKLFFTPGVSTDEAASIINNALSNQSFGGENEEEAPPSA